MGLMIDCETCPVRGLHCGDCIVPVLARTWLEDPEPVRRRVPTGPAEASSATMSLDFEETEVVEDFLRAGLISRADARGLRAHSTARWVAVG